MPQQNVSVDQGRKAEQFRALHAREKPFIIANPWDAGSARILEGLGFEALATSSGAFAGTMGRRDGKVGRDEAMAHARAIVEAVDVPVSADFENGFGAAPSFVAETVTLAAETGLVGCSIEDATGDSNAPLYGFDDAVARVDSAAKAARVVGFEFTLTARTECFLRGVSDLDEVIKRLQAF
jgi:2-methylisocitrate lyase-like PEP mutase family enzyme